MLPILEAAKNWDWDEDEKAEDLMDQWIEQTANELHPESERAERAVRTTLLYLLENRAMTRVKEIHPEWMPYLPEVLTPEEAVELAMREMYLNEEDKAATDETKAKIRSQILSDVGGNNQAAVALLERMTAFTGKDGKEIPGVANIEKLSEGRAFTTWGRIKPGGKDREAYENALADVKDRFNLWDERPQE